MMGEERRGGAAGKRGGTGREEGMGGEKNVIELLQVEC